MASASASNVSVAPPASVFSLQHQAHTSAGGFKREMLSHARAQELLRPLLAEKVHAVDHIVLGGYSFGLDSAPVVSSALLQTPSLTHADFSDCIAGRETDEALATLQVLCDGLGAAGVKLRTLNLSDNALGVRGIPKIRAAFAGQRDIKHVFFNNNGLQSEAVTGLTELIMKNADGGVTALETLEIGDNCLEDAGFHALIPLVSASPALRSLTIATTRVRNNEGAGLAMSRALLKHQHLTSLSLNDNNLGREAATVLAQVIANNAHHLQHLNIGDIGVEDEGVVEMLQSLGKLKPNTLQLLDLTANEITGSSRFLKPLCKAIRAQVGSLTSLKMEDNELKSRGVLKLLAALKGAQLQSLNLNNMQLDYKCAPALADFIATQASLTELHLNGNKFSAESLAELKAAVAKAGKTAALQTTSDNEDDEEVDEDEASEEDEEPEEAEAKADADVDALASSLAASSVAK